MKAVNIKLSLAENVKSFVNIANRYPYDIDLRVGRHVVDGKSILGIFSLDLSKPITLEVYSDHCDDLMAVSYTHLAGSECPPERSAARMRASSSSISNGLVM